MYILMVSNVPNLCRPLVVQHRDSCNQNLPGSGFSRLLEDSGFRLAEAPWSFVAFEEGELRFLLRPPHSACGGCCGADGGVACVPARGEPNRFRRRCLNKLSQHRPQQGERCVTFFHTL